MFILSALLATASAGSLGVWYGEVTEDWDTRWLRQRCGDERHRGRLRHDDDGARRSRRGARVCRGDLTAADPLEGSAYDAAASSGAYATEIVARVNWWADIGMTRSDWETALEDALDDIATLGSTSVTAMTIHELHKDLLPKYNDDPDEDGVTDLQDAVRAR